MTTSAVTALQVEDEDFIIASLIERCPKSMMIRELMMNALEAAQHAPEGHRFVEISSIPMDGIDKLVNWNTGRGMDDYELLKICNIASSLGKEKSLTGNFGMGAKVAFATIQSTAANFLDFRRFAFTTTVENVWPAPSARGFVEIGG
jgi:hypothetical protein